MVLALSATQVASASEQQVAADSSSPLARLVDAAKKEKQLVIGFPGNINPGRAKRVETAFTKRFGLSLRFGSSQKESSDTVTEAILEMKTGLAPTYDLLEMPEVRAMTLVGVGATEPIENWQEILKELDSSVIADRVSPKNGPLRGHAFAWGHRVKALSYNPTMISEAQLPKTWIDLGKPEYKNKFSLTPWVSELQYGLLVYSKDELMNIVKRAAQNAIGIYKYSDANNRMLLGQFPFMPDNAESYFAVKEKAPNAPMALTFFEDAIPVSDSVYLVIKGTKSPNAAKLFALWAATAEANRLWEDEFRGTGSLAVPSSKTGSAISKELQKRGLKPMTWWDSEKSIDTIKFYATPEGIAYTEQLSKTLIGKN
jgi:ABC-type Fe3+ transport system substrate-binding protein